METSAALGKPETLYKHRQIGVATMVTLGVDALVCLALSLAVSAPHARMTLLTIAGILGICTVLFCTLTVELSQDSLSWHFGPGILRKKVAITEVKDAAVTKIRFIHGWGVHLTGRGWLYNVSGFHAVEIALKSGKSFLLGSDEPEQLCSAIRRAIKS
jgi:hypothetical protein